VPPHPHWLNFVRVTDAGAAAAKAVALGGRVLVKPHLDRHGGKAAIIADPTGAPVGPDGMVRQRREGGGQMSLNFPVGKLDIVPWKPTALAMLLLVVLCGCAYPGVSYGGAVAVDFEDGYPGDYFETLRIRVRRLGGRLPGGSAAAWGASTGTSRTPLPCATSLSPMPSIPSRPRGRR